MSTGQILLIEDEPDIQNIYHAVLQDSGFNVDQAVDGIEGLQKIKTKLYDIILLDVVMPKAHGLDILKKIPESHNKKTPVIIMSNLDQENIVQEALQNGANEYIIKSNILPDELIKLVQRNIKTP